MIDNAKKLSKAASPRPYAPVCRYCYPYSSARICMAFKKNLIYKNRKNFCFSLHYLRFLKPRPENFTMFASR
ncbi:MAG: hypothetical protein J1D85_03905, partial [Bacteroidales bacterium]|nr:hypothetical protein [Bacteroidales bacterium]